MSNLERLQCESCRLNYVRSMETACVLLGLKCAVSRSSTKICTGGRSWLRCISGWRPLKGRVLFKGTRVSTEHLLTADSE